MLGKRKNYSGEDKTRYKELRSSIRKDSASFIASCLAAAGLAFGGMYTFAKVEGPPVEYGNLEKSQEYFDGLVEKLDKDKELFNSTTNVPEMVDFSKQFGSQYLEQREFARSAHYSLQRKIDEFDFDRDYKKRNRFRFFAIIGLAIGTYHFWKKSSEACDDFFDSRNEFRDLKKKYAYVEKIEVSDDHSGPEWKGGH